MAALTQAEQIQQEIAQLQEALVSANPGMPTMLRTIHKALRDDPATVTLLSDEEVATIVAALMKQTNTVIAAAVTKKSTKSLRGITINDL
jgi:hypothetical protein